MPEQSNPTQEEKVPLQDSSQEQKEEVRVGVYVCNCGGNIGDVVRCEQVARALGELPNVVTSHSDMFMCSDPGQKLITDDIREKGVNRIVVGACSIFLHEQTFRQTVERAGLNPYLYYHVGLREQDSWVHHDCPNEATEKAVRMMSAGIAKARLMRPLEPVQLQAEKHALVIGGGVAGLRAALDISRSGLKVTLVEKSHFLGGRMAQWQHVFPTGEDARTLLHRLIERVLAEPNITIHTGAEVVEAKGYVGNFQVHIRQQPRGIDGNFDAVAQAIAACPVEVADEFNYGLQTRKAIYRPYKGCYPASPVIDWEHCTRCEECLKSSHNGDIRLDDTPFEFDINAGAVVVATGFRPYEPFPGEMGYGEFPEVITLPQLERLLAPDGPTGGELEWNGHPVRSIAMIHCVGSRQIEGVHQPQPDGHVNDYCSRVCCTATLSAANQIRERYPDVHTYDIYEDIRTYGRGQEDYYTQASQNQVTFLRYFAEEIPEVYQAENGSQHPLLVKVKDHLTWGEEIELPVDLVVLSVGMMPNPIQDLIETFNITPGNDRFLLEVHPKLQPVETAVNGIVLAGTAQGPMNIQESCAAAEAAASKVAILLNKGKVELEPYVAHVDADRCQGSGDCVRICPQDGAIHLETFSRNGASAQRAVVTPANCNGCGVCVSVCPNQAIDVQGWRLDEYQAMVDAITAEIPVLEGVA
ncbi:MAG: CoB--CoM heterodisulfide reductase iron-sulfur subunit A family protein [Chloroflexota bacterium]|nr:CoB--CoM heterodisulfide reductase iron-sulfur subunit A family protein [Chloroflexota bacterium]